MKSVRVELPFPWENMTFFAVNILCTYVQLEEKNSVVADLKTLLLKITGGLSRKLMFIHIYSVLRYFRAQGNEVLITLA